MPLLADFQARFSTQQRTEWSNPQASGATTPDTAQETRAAADAQADFEAVCGVAYLSSNATHVAAGVPLVMERLKLYAGQSTQELYQKLVDRLTNIYRLVLGRNRIEPTTDSLLTPTTDRVNDKPWSDRTIFNRLIGNSPDGPTTTDPASGETIQRD